jgi:DNA-binding MarR family transcriptional regulator
MARPQHISDDTIVKALAAAGEVTAAALADRLGIGQSTAAKRLAALEGTGSVRRQPGGRVNGVRAADRWSVPAAPSVDAAAPNSGPHTSDVNAPSGDGGPIETATPEAVEPATVEGVAPEPGTERLGRGVLGTLVREYLAARPDEDLGPTQVGKALGRSQGAVSNALARLEAAGEVRLVTVTPRRYRIVADR